MTTAQIWFHSRAQECVFFLTGISKIQHGIYRLPDIMDTRVLVREYLRFRGDVTSSQDHVVEKNIWKLGAEIRIVNLSHSKIWKMRWPAEFLLDTMKHGNLISNISRSGWRGCSPFFFLFELRKDSMTTMACGLAAQKPVFGWFWMLKIDPATWFSRDWTSRLYYVLLLFQDLFFCIRFHMF